MSAVMQRFTFMLNGNEHTAEAHPITRLLDVLRDLLRHTGTKEGCGEGECGACAVLLNGKLVNSCLVPMGQVAGGAVRTIEGVKSSPALAALQKAFVVTNGTQCGFCTPGMIMAAVELMERNTHPSDEEIREAMAGNLCRCTGYVKIVEAIRMGCDHLNSGGTSC